MTVKELIEKLSAYDGEMNVVFRTTEQFEIDEYETDTIYHSHEIDIHTSDWVESGPWEIKKTTPYVVIEIKE